MSSPDSGGDGVSPPGTGSSGTSGSLPPEAADAFRSASSQVSGRRTMPPPELADRVAPASVTELLITAAKAESPVPRHGGPRAEEGSLRARLVERQAAGDADGERDAAIALARLLAARGTDLDAATKLARRALSLGDDPPLRTELAGWLAGLGESGLAAATLRGLCDNARPVETSRTLVKIAVLLARGGDAQGSAEALFEAAALDGEDAMAGELLGTLAAWAPDLVPPAAAAAAYLEAAERRDKQNDKEAAFEDRLRAFELAPGDEPSARALAESLAGQGRLGAADEVLRHHAAIASATLADGGAAAQAVHQARLLNALREGEPARAVGAVLDGRYEAEVEGASALRVDEALSAAGLYELYATRLEIRGERQRTSAGRADVYQTLARLYSGPLASPERAIEAWISVLGADPSNDGALTALREHGTHTGDQGALVEALIRAGESGSGTAAARIAAMRTLVGIAEGPYDTPTLAAWALERIGSAGGVADMLAAEAAPHLARAKHRTDAIDVTRRALEAGTDASGKLDALRRLAATYRGRPDSREEHAAVLAELSRLLPDDRGVLLSLERLATRGEHAIKPPAVPAAEQLERVFQERAKAEGDGKRSERTRARLALSALLRRRGELSEALDVLLPILDETPGQRAAASAALILATMTHRHAERARALEELAGPAWPALRSVLLASAAVIQVLLGDIDRGRALATLACEADNGPARAVTELALIAKASPDRVGAAAIERAMTAVVPRGDLCDALAATLEGLGEDQLAFAWTQRWLALRPGAPRAMSELLRRATALGDAVRLADAVAWVLAQPEPLAELVPAIADGLDRLLAIDRTKARALSRKALDVVGPRVAALRDRLVAFAEAASDPGLAIAVLERHLASQPIEQAAADVLFELAARRARANDFDGAARELARAAERGADARTVLARADALELAAREASAWLGSDGLIALTQARAQALTSMGPEAVTSAGNAWRDLGSLRWDLSGDQIGAEEAFYRAGELVPKGGVARFARDLTDFGGEEHAMYALVRRAERAESNGIRAELLIEAAALAHGLGRTAEALRAAVMAVNSDPSRADALPFIEKNAIDDAGVVLLDRAYEAVAGAALGQYGRRAAHARGSRQLERRGAVDRALRHAALALEALPSEGTGFLALVRLAERADDPSEAVRALERISEKSNATNRTAWLKHAAALTGRGEEAARSRLDLLLRALNSSPDASTVVDVARAVDELRRHGDDADASAMRIARAVKAAIPRLDGPEGSRAAIAMAELAAQLGAGELAFAALTRAMAADGDIDEFVSLVRYVDLLAADPGARAWVKSVGEAAEKPYSSVGAPLLRLASRVATTLDDGTAAAALLVHAARRSPEDDALVTDAEALVAEVGDADLRKALHEAFPAQRRIDALMHLADAHEREGRAPQAIAALDRVLASGEVTGVDRDRIVVRLRGMLRFENRLEELERIVRFELAREDITPALRVKLSRELADLLGTRGADADALEVLAACARAGATDVDLLADVRGLSRRTGELRLLASLLAAMLDRAPDDAARLLLLRELGPLRAEIGDRVGAMNAFEAIARLSGADIEALEALEQDANERGDHARIAELLARRIASAPDERRRMLRLRRAAVLEQRLDRLEDATGELKALLAEDKDDVSALRYLADLYDRLGKPLEAGPLLRRLADLATSTDERAEYGLRACMMFLAGDELTTAQTVLDDVAPLAAIESVVELRVELARRRGDGRALSDALEQLAASSREPAERRAAILVDAARAASTIGDDNLALDRIRRAQKLHGGGTEAILEARRLEYKLGGSGTPREAQAFVDELLRIEKDLVPGQIELYAFLLAEELDVIQGGGAGMRELTRRHAEIGPVPLVALGMAERLVRARNFETALPLYERALAGDLRGLRQRARVALNAAECAVATNGLDLAEQFLKIAAGEPETRGVAERKRLEIVALRGEPDSARKALEELAKQTTGVDRARVLLQLGRLLATRDPSAASKALAEAEPLSAGDKNLRKDVLEEIDRVIDPDHAPTRESEPQMVRDDELEPVSTSNDENVEPAAEAAAPDPASPTLAEEPAREIAPPPPPSKTIPEAPLFALLPPSRPSPTVPDPEPPRVSPTLIDDEPEAAAAGSREGSPSSSFEMSAASEPGSSDGSTSDPPLSQVVPQPPPSVVLRAIDPDEQAFLRNLMRGSLEAGERLLAMYTAAPAERAHDVLAVLRQMVLRAPGDRTLVERLHEAAVADRNTLYATAIEHVLATFTRGGNPPPAPPLSSQREAPELVHALLFRSIVESGAHQALAIVWDTGLFKRDLAAYGLTGVERVQPGGATPLGEACAQVARLLGQGKTPVFHRRAAGAALEARIALNTPPAVFIGGEVQGDSPELRYVLGAAMAGAMPEHALVNGLPEPELRVVLDALLAAFGPLGAVPRENARAVRLAQDLWQLVPRRHERRLRTICESPGALDATEVIARTRQAMRRAGLFAAGDVGTVVQLAATELRTPLDSSRSPGEIGLAAMCGAHPGLADLVTLALRNEYAEARWQPAPTSDRRRADSGSKLRSPT